MNEPIRVAIMGMTGAGKSSFIKTLIPEAEIAIGEDMNSQTTEPEAFMALIDGILFELVDTPGFGDTRRSDEEVTRCISEYLAARHVLGELFHGVIYLHSLSHTRVSGSMMAQIRAFKAICGSMFFSRLVIGSTFWEATTDLSTALAYEAQLYSADGIFEDVIDSGAQTTRVFRNYEACLEAVRLIPRDEPLPLQVQSELRTDGDFNHTSAAAAVSPEQHRRQQEHEEQLRLEQEAAERERLERELQAARDEAQRALEIAQAERLRLLDLARRQREYEEQEIRRREEEKHQDHLRRIERQKAEEERKEMERAAKLKAEQERLAEAQRQREEEKQREEKRQYERRLEELRRVEEERHQRLRQLERSREGYRNWHISWYHDSRLCWGNSGEFCQNHIRDGMKCWDCDLIICFPCFNRRRRLDHLGRCIYS